ncbi:hypothetical protein CDAR_471071 [Caerostris darwini]|uniref:LAGLIDADG homing endonuclease n=1 Tax=Caerostris darwini TaxID=1538125 RepID=A0AAV4QMZ7_9ARAC|nr:hypothetical protein CDAR_471071 [Caerostris darwini]
MRLPLPPVFWFKSSLCENTSPVVCESPQNKAPTPVVPFSPCSNLFFSLRSGRILFVDGKHHYSKEAKGDGKHHCSKEAKRGGGSGSFEFRYWQYWGGDSEQCTRVCRALLDWEHTRLHARSYLGEKTIPGAILLLNKILRARHFLPYQSQKIKNLLFKWFGQFS